MARLLWVGVVTWTLAPPVRALAPLQVNLEGLQETRFQTKLCVFVCVDVCVCVYIYIGSLLDAVLHFCYNKTLIRIKNENF